MVENTVLKSVWARTQPCFTPFITGKASEWSLHHAIMKLSDDHCDLARTAKLLNYLSKPSLLRSTKVPKKSLLAFFLELACSKYHVGRSTFWAETTLAFWKETLSKMLDEGVEQDAGQDLASKAKGRNTLVITTRLAIAFPLDYAGIF